MEAFDTSFPSQFNHQIEDRRASFTPFSCFGNDNSSRSSSCTSTSSSASLDTSLTNHKEYWTIDDFEFRKEIGRGQFARVYEVKEKSLRKKCALKVFEKERLPKLTRGIGDQTWQDLLAREVSIQSNLKHKHIVRLWGYFFDDARIYFIMEFCKNGSLYDLLKREERLSERRTALFVSQIIDALLYCHSRNVIHRDLKPENILMVNDHLIKLTDFGFSRILKEQERRQTICGTLDYLSPEVCELRLNRNGDYDSFVDIWSVGVITYELLTGQPPFYEPNQIATMNKIQRIEYEMPSDVSDEARDFIASIFVHEESDRDRPTLETLCVHPFLRFS